MMKKLHTANNQMAFSYALYMMLGSYFRKTVCTSSIMEQKMHLWYAEVQKDTQLNMEKQCISYIEKKLIPVMPKAFWNEKMEVHLSMDERRERIELRFEGAEYMLRVFVNPVGRKSEIAYEIWTYGDRVKIRKKHPKAA